MEGLTAARAAVACGGRLVGEGGRTARAVGADSRTIEPGVAFAAIGRGHEFVGEAISRGAPFVIVSDERCLPQRACAVVVTDVVVALGRLAADVRHDIGALVVAVTGSTGKTLTKDFLAAALGSQARVHAAPHSFNTEIGVPLVLLSTPPATEVLVVELGARHEGEIAELCHIVRPGVGVLTGIGLAHLGEFGSRDAIARTKTDLLACLPPDGLAIVSVDDDYLALSSERAPARLVTVGPGAEVGWWAEGVDAWGRTRGGVRVGRKRYPVTIPLAGRPLLRNAALAVATASSLGIDPARAAQALAEAPTTGRRMELLRVGPWLLCNDAYNANPTSVAAALRSVRELAGARPAWAVLGPMAELGPLAPEAHRRCGRLAAKLGFAGLVAVGEEARLVAEGAGSIGAWTAGAEEAAQLVRERVPQGSVVLVKASRIVGLDTFPKLLERRR